MQVDSSLVVDMPAKWQALQGTDKHGPCAFMLHRYQGVLPYIDE